ncbi:hypothetical protein SAMN04488066_108101 [Halorubrum aquaticum]|uniref:Flagellin N-terminal-like domain-containing protein n=1 Tax=Halorubrum aquaticum TaxID=387340 RepID=A0A1I3B163_9EURY|nr:hypothetical protein [Halorubrum aquaticum]SFH55679.1 hypothetical protein SAMN04488066_108101 [Halorubrum aquaticum]
MSHGRRDGTGGSGGWPFAPDDRAVSDVVGYVLVFALVTATIASVFAVGMTGLEDRRNAERVENVERAFDVFDDNLRDVQRYGDPSRATEIRLSGGELSLSSTTNVTVEQVDSSGARIGNHTTRTVHAVTYTRGETTIGYDAGARFRTDGDSTLFRSTPRFVSTAGETNRTVLPVVRTRPGDGPSAADGEGTVQITATASDVKRFEFPEEGLDPHAIRIRIESPRADAWERYLDETEGFTVDSTETSGDVVVADIDRDEAVYVRVIVVDVSYRR